ncbi:MAG: hypothetical protein J0M02_18660, partial [Planctomycetes bacterium]|nr:hypothetical protein [Planctomycetota bacterium]
GKASHEAGLACEVHLEPQVAGDLVDDRHETPAPQRWQQGLRPLQVGGNLVIDDCYNANPASMQAGLAVLADRGGRRLAVLGHMGELGAASLHGHRLVGSEAARLGVALIAVGPLAQPILDAYHEAGGADGRHVADRQAAGRMAVQWMRDAGACSVLVKGSRSAHLEDALTEICTGFGAKFPGGVH